MKLVSFIQSDVPRISDFQNPAVLQRFGTLPEDFDLGIKSSKPATKMSHMTAFQNEPEPLSVLADILSQHPVPTEVHFLGCSDATEAYLLGAILASKVPQANQTFRFKGCDTAASLIQLVQQRILAIASKDGNAIREHTGRYLTNFFTAISNPDYTGGVLEKLRKFQKSGLTLFKPVESLQQFFDYEDFQATDILSYLKTVQPKADKRTAYVCRNVLLYLQNPDLQAVVDLFSQKTKPGDVVVLASLDVHNRLADPVKYERAVAEIARQKQLANRSLSLSSARKSAKQGIDANKAEREALLRQINAIERFKKAGFIPRVVTNPKLKEAENLVWVKQ